MARTLVVGDIHGGFRALQQVAERAELQSDDRLIFLGDYVDGWSQSPEVIEYLLELESKYACIFMLGNHDEWCDEWLRGWSVPEDWLIHGGQATVDSYAAIGPAQKERHLEFFSRTLPYYEDRHRRLFVHAGFSSIHGPAKEHFPSNFFWDRTLWETAVAVDGLVPRGSKYYPKRLMLYDEIYIGHTPTTNYDIETPMHRCNVWNVDTGAAFQGRISMLDIDTKQYWQSDAVLHFYPDEKGRNK